MTRIAELRQNMAATHAQIQGILAKSREEKRGLNTEESAAYDKASEEYIAFNKTLQAEERLASMTETLDRPEIRPAPADDKLTEKEKRALAYSAYLRVGVGGLNEEYRTILSSTFRPDSDIPKALASMPEARALSANVSTGLAAGAYTIPEGFRADLVKAMKAYSGFGFAEGDGGVGSVITTETGNPLPWPTMNDTSNVGVELAENTAAGEQDLAFNVVTLGAIKYTTKMIRVPNELLQDSGVDITGVINTALAERAGRILNTRFTTGNGTTQPQGVVTFATLGKTTAAAAAVTRTEILDLIHSVDPAYRQPAQLMFNDAVLKVLMQLVDGNGLPLYQFSPRDGAPLTVEGRTYVINQDMASLGTTNKFMLFGDFRFYKIRSARPVSIIRLNERYGEMDQVAFVGFTRWDAKGIDASGGAIKYMANA